MQLFAFAVAGLLACAYDSAQACIAILLPHANPVAAAAAHVAESEVIFRGVAVDGGDVGNLTMDGIPIIRFRFIEAFKGVQRGALIDVRTHTSECGAAFRKGELRLFLLKADAVGEFYHDAKDIRGETPEYRPLLEIEKAKLK